MREHIEINTISVAVGLYLFLTFFYTFLSYFSWNVLLVVFLTLLIIALLSRCYAGYYLKKFTFLMLFWGCVFLMSVKNNGYLEIGRYTNFFLYLLAVAMAYMLQYSTGWYRAYAKWTAVFSLVHFFTSWLFLLCQPLYRSLIVPLFGSARRARLLGYARSHILMGLTDHYSTSGIYFAFAVLVFWVLFLTGKRYRRWKLFAALAMFVSLLMTQKRGPLLYVTLIMLVTYLVWNRLRFDTLVRLACMAVLGILLVLVGIRLYPDLGNVFLRFAATEDITNGRDIIYDFAKEMFRQHPVFGIGWGQFSIYFARQFYNGNYKVKMEAHNIYLQLLTEMGVVGAVLVYLMFAWALGANFLMIRRFVRSGRSEEPDAAVEGFALLFAFAMQIFFLLYGITENPLYDNQCQMMYFLSVAVVCSEKMKRGGKEKEL